MGVIRLTSRIGRLLAAGTLIAGLAGLASTAAAPAASAQSGVGWLRLAHLSPNTPAVDVYLYSFGNPSARVVLHHVAYGDVSPYEQVPAGQYTVAMRGAGAASSSKPVLSTSVDVAAGRAYTVAGMGPYSGIRLQVVPDRLVTPKGKVLVRVIQASMHQTRVTVTLNGQKLASKLAFSHVSRYVAVSPGTLAVHVAGSSESATKTVSLAAGSIHTLVVLDASSSALGVDDLMDAQGSKAIPSGSAATGFGGTAPRPGAPLLPWLGAAALGLVAASGGALWASRRRRPALHAR
ncbi:MAG TPA: DUF4397 domain-containing protein [Streptosporangiaceae bacterium]